jgi:hypothetical protein
MALMSALAENLLFSIVPNSLSLSLSLSLILSFLSRSFKTLYVLSEVPPVNAKKSDFRKYGYDISIVLPQSHGIILIFDA